MSDPLWLRIADTKAAIHRCRTVENGLFYTDGDRTAARAERAVLQAELNAMHEEAQARKDALRTAELIGTDR